MRATRDDNFGPTQMALGGVRCGTEPVCALVAAVYASAPW